MVKKLTVRVEEDFYERFKEYAEECGESMKALAIKAITALMEGDAVTEPSQEKPPAPKPKPVAEPMEIPGEILGLPGRVRTLEEKVAEVAGTIDGLTMSVDRLQRQVSTFLSAYSTMLPPRQREKWSSFMEEADLGEMAQPGGKKQKRVTSKKPARKPKK